MSKKASVTWTERQQTGFPEGTIAAGYRVSMTGDTPPVALRSAGRTVRKAVPAGRNRAPNVFSDGSPAPDDVAGETSTIDIDAPGPVEFVLEAGHYTATVWRLSSTGAVLGGSSTSFEVSVKPGDTVTVSVSVPDRVTAIVSEELPQVDPPPSQDETAKRAREAERVQEANRELEKDAIRHPAHDPERARR